MKHRYNIEAPESTNSGIYMLYNLTNHKIYIGQTENIQKRAKQHKQLLESNLHSNKDLQTDYNSGCDFAFVVLEMCESGQKYLLVKELQYIYAFRDKGVKLYNKESKEKAQERLFYEMVFPSVRLIQQDFTRSFHITLAAMSRAKPETLIKKFSKDNKEG